MIYHYFDMGILNIVFFKITSQIANNSFGQIYQSKLVTWQRKANNFELEACKLHVFYFAANVKWILVKKVRLPFMFLTSTTNQLNYAL